MPDNELMYYVQQLSLLGKDYPHHSNRGVITKPETFVFSHLDYLSLMFPYPERGLSRGFARLPIPEDMFDIGAIEPGVKNWKQSCSMLPAGRFYWNDGEPDKGSYGVFAGDDLALIRAYFKMQDDELLERLCFNATSVTRIDFCINTTGGDVGETRREFEAGRKKSRVRIAWEPDYFAGGNGRTIYFGSRGSDKMLRVYEKAREMKLAAGIILNRIELQVRHDPADRLAKVMKKNTVLDVGKTAIRAFCDFPELEWYQDALSGARDVPMQLTPAKETDYMKWLNEQVGPSIVKRIEAGEHTAEIRDWLHALWEILRVGQPDASDT